MITLSVYNNVIIDGYATHITVVRQDENTFYIWLDDLRDIEHYKTGGFVIKRHAEHTTIHAVHEGGTLPNNFDVMLSQIINSHPDRQHHISDFLQD